MGRLRQDLIVSLRRLRQTPGFTLAAILTLALGIGADTTIFTAVNANRITSIGFSAAGGNNSRIPPVARSASIP